MPYRWTEDTQTKVLTLWPHQSLTRKGFAWFIGATAVMLAMPLLAVLGSPVAWVLTGFFLIPLWGVWRAVVANHNHRSLHEELTLSTDRLHLAHIPFRGRAMEWEANPHWVTVNLRRDGPVEQYLTLKGGGREVELGAFLTPEERQELYGDLHRLMRG